MDINKGKQPRTWNEYDTGARASVDSGRSVHWDQLERTQSETMPSGSASRYGAGDLRRRRSSMTMRMQALGDAGGVNSINNFARSWQRAAGFFEITPVQNIFRVESDDGRDDDFARSVAPSEHAVDDEERYATEETHLLPSAVEDRLSHRRAHRDSILSIAPSLSSPLGGSYGTGYGSLSARVNESSMMHAGRLFTENQLKSAVETEEREPLLVKQVEEDGKLINVVVGRSTVPQTIFNSVNVLVGVGLLSLPLAFKYSGWLIGMVFLLYSAIATAYTAKLLAKCLDVDSSLITFADLAYVSFGNKARIAVSILFSLELLAACVALVVLFADSMDDLLSSWDLGLVGWKIVCGFILIPLIFLPLRFLSFTSVLGVMCCIAITLLVWLDGLIKPDAPGSLREPMPQYFLPSNWLAVPLSLGLLMSPWGGHSVFPNIYRDMRHPYKYRRSVDITYFFTYLIDVGMAVAGILMFGDGVRDEITSNIFTTDGYPKAVSVIIAMCIAIIPLTKIPLNARPIVSTLEIMCGLDNRSLAASSSLNGMSGMTRGISKFILRIFMIGVFVLIAIVCPSFDRIMTLLGSVACFSICIILPVAFHLKLFGKELSSGEKALNWTLLIANTIMASVSTVFAFFPKDVLGISE